MPAPKIITVAPGVYFESGTAPETFKKGQARGARVLIWEYDAAHPTEDGEIYITEDSPETQVALTSGVQERLDNGRLLQVGKS